MGVAKMSKTNKPKNQFENKMKKEKPFSNVNHAEVGVDKNQVKGRNCVQVRN